MRKRKKLGEMLLEAGLIEKTQLEKALSNYKKSGIKLGQYMVREGMVSEEAIVNLLSDQVKIKKYTPGEFPTTTSLSKFIDVDTAKKLQAVPIGQKGSILSVAMIDPLDITALDHIEIQTDMEVIPIICTEHDFNLLVASIYGSYAGKDGMLGNIQEFEEMDVIEEDSMAAEEQSGMALHDMAEEAPIIRLVNSILTQAVQEGASDIHVSPEKKNIEIRFRVDGKLHHVPAPPKSMFLSMVSRLKILANLDISISRIPQDGRFTVFVNEREINIRVSTIPTVYGENVVLRLLDTSTGIYSLENLGVSENDQRLIEKMIKKPYGMILCTGPTGSGKSTSLFSMLKLINTPDMNIITLEDPVEYRMDHIRQTQLNKKAGMTFASGLRSILRQDPDVIMVGEIRDSETAGVAVQAALTGHLVLSTVHTNDAAGAITRFVDMGIEPFLASSVMLLSIAQRLIRKVCPNCKESYKPSPEILKFWELESAQGVDFVRGKGCFQCKNTGYKGRVGLYEVLHIDEDVKEMILKGYSAQQITKECTLSGRLTTLKNDAAMKVANGITSAEEAASAVMM
ncbi:MAG: ATPase, T2SS/T4P/T4SS family [Pseudomonadota bacterium]